MTRDSQGSSRQLRRDAEARLEHEEPPSAAIDADRSPETLVHELRVHQIELETQNAQLLESRRQLEELLSLYMQLYDFAPVGQA